MKKREYHLNDMVDEISKLQDQTIKLTSETELIKTEEPPYRKFKTNNRDYIKRVKSLLSFTKYKEFSSFKYFMSSLSVEIIKELEDECSKLIKSYKVTLPYFLINGKNNQIMKHSWVIYSFLFNLKKHMIQLHICFINPLY